MAHAGEGYDGNPITVEGVSRKYSRKVALDNVSLTVQPGTVFGLVGENGAGKTTLIKHILGLLAPQSGRVRVLGMDPVALPEKVLARLGYLSEDRDLPQWVTIGELMKYSSAFYPDWDQAYAEELRLRLGLDDLQAKVKHLSRGERAKAGLLVALAYRPELLVLDEPSAGLDAAVRRHILGAIIRTVAEEGRTVLFSSHLLDEVERVSDHVAMLVNGRILFAGALDEIRASHRLLGYRFPIPMSSAPSLPGALGLGRHGPGLDGRLQRPARRTQAGRGGNESRAHRRPSAQPRRSVSRAVPRRPPRHGEVEP